MRDNCKAQVWFADRVTDGFTVKVELYPGLGPSLFLFAVVLGRLTDEVRLDAP